MKLLDRVMDYVDRHLGGGVTNRPHQKNRRNNDATSGVGAGDSSGSGSGFDDCVGDAGGGGDCGGDGGGGDGGGGGD
jgi:hypothetical protein